MYPSRTSGSLSKPLENRLVHTAIDLFYVNLLNAQIELLEDSQNDLITDNLRAYTQTIMDLRHKALKSIVNGEYTISFTLLRVSIEVFLRMLLTVSLEVRILRDRANIQFRGKKIGRQDVEKYLLEVFEEESIRKLELLDYLTNIGIFIGLDKLDRIYKICNKYVHQTVSTSDYSIEENGIKLPTFDVKINFDTIDFFLFQFINVSDLILCNILKFIGFEFIWAFKEGKFGDMKIEFPIELEKSDINYKTLIAAELTRTINTLTELNQEILDMISSL